MPHIVPLLCCPFEGEREREEEGERREVTEIITPRDANDAIDSRFSTRVWPTFDLSSSSS